MKKILSFGGGLQTTALAILIVQGKLEVDEIVFADTGAEKPETYWYMENYISPMLTEIKMPFTVVRNIQPSRCGGLYEYCWHTQNIPSIYQRHCTDHYKIRPIRKHIGKDGVELLIGFSLDESYRARKKGNQREGRRFPLIEKGMTADDCRNIIREYGFPLPIKSSCYFCQFQHPVEWNWLKTNHPDLFQKALALEARYHKRKPQHKNSFGLLRGTPLWKMKDGIQPEMFQLEERACWSGYCSH